MTKLLTLCPDGTFAQVATATTGGTSSQAGQVPALNPNGKIDDSLINTIVSTAITEVVTGTTVLSDAFNNVIVNSQTDCSIFLPAGYNNQMYSIKSVCSAQVTVTPFAGDTIENNSSLNVLQGNEYDLVYFSGTWYIN